MRKRRLVLLGAVLSLFVTLVAGAALRTATAEPVTIAADRHPVPCNDSGRNLSLTRDQIIKRAKSWLNVVPYSLVWPGRPG